MISIAEYAEKHGKSHIAVRKMAARGGFKTAVKIARNWIIDENEPYPDARITVETTVPQRPDNPGHEKVPREFIAGGEYE